MVIMIFDLYHWTHFLRLIISLRMSPSSILSHREICSMRILISLRSAECKIPLGDLSCMAEIVPVADSFHS